MKAIFLDHDGVICLSTEWGSRFNKPGRYTTHQFDNFNKKAVSVLNSIIKETDAEIVVSSDWRYYCTLEEMGVVYTDAKISKKPIDYIPRGDFSPDNFKYTRQSDLAQRRSWEIKKYLSERNDITHWVAIDDMYMGEIYDFDKNFLWGLSNFVHTPRSSEGIKQSGVKDKILKFLK